MSEWGRFYRDRARDDWGRFLREPQEWSSIVTAVDELRPRRILEVGCGPGSMSIFFSFLYPEVVGLDLDAEVLAVARARNERFHGRARFLRADAFRIPFADDSFDCAVNQGFFEHYQDEEIHVLLGECLRVARHVVFTVPNANHPTHDYGDERLLTKEEWDRILAPIPVVTSREEGVEAAWHSLPRRIYEMTCSLVLKRDVRRPRRYFAHLRRPAGPDDTVAAEEETA